MARVTVEDCVDKVPNRFELVMLAAHRAREIAAGSPAGMADLIALWLLLERCGAVREQVTAPPAGDVTTYLAAHFGLKDITPSALGVEGLARFHGIAR